MRPRPSPDCRPSSPDGVGGAEPVRLRTFGALALDGAAPPAEELLPAGGRKLLLLGYLAHAAEARPRDHLAARFWPGRDPERARHSLRDALSTVRRALGPDVLDVRGQVVAFVPGRGVGVDALALREAARAGNAAAVLELYAGPFLDGVPADGLPEVGWWMAGERAALHAEFLRACAAECEAAERRDDWARSGAVAARWLASEPMAGAAMQALLRAGAAPDTPDALRGALDRHARHAARLAEEFGEPVPPEAARLAERLARRLARLTAPPAAPAGPAVADGSPRPSGLPNAVPAPAPAPTPAPPPAPAAARPLRAAARLSRLAAAAAAAAAVAFALGGPARAGGDAPAPPPPALAVTRLGAAGAGPEDAWLGEGARELLAASLARESIERVEVLDAGQVRAAEREVRRAAADTAAFGDAERGAVARRLGAALVVGGAVTHADGSYALDLDVRDRAGAVRSRVRVEHHTLFGAVAQATARLAGALAAHDAPVREEGVETTSLPAYRAFVRGRLALADDRRADAAAAFDEALAHDSAFAAALVQRRLLLGSPLTAGARDTAARLADAFARHRARASEFDRALLDALAAERAGQHARAEALARSLAARWPRDPRARDQFARILWLHGRFAELGDATAGWLAGDAPDGDRAGPGAGPGAACARCPALRWQTLAALEAGDLARAEAAAREVTRRRPEAPEAWVELSRVLSIAGRHDEAAAAAARAAWLGPGPQHAREVALRLAEAGRLDSAAAWAAVARAASAPAVAASGWEAHATVLSERGQYAEAARALARAAELAPGAATVYALPQGVALARAGNVAGARAVLERAAHAAAGGARAGDPLRLPEDARRFAWTHAVLADALWEAGAIDAATLRALADSVEAVGALSYFGRDWRVHHHLRGLLALGAGRLDEAERELTAATWGRYGWARTSLVLAEVQRRRGRPGDALATLRRARRGLLDGPGRYARRADVAAATARALADAGPAGGPAGGPPAVAQR